MIRNGKRWVFPSPEADVVEKLVRELQVAPAVARVLVNRGLGELSQARAFLNPSLEQIASPRLLQGMDRAVERIQQALDRGEQVAVYGDYDADGITATALLVETLRELGGEPRFVLPSRFEQGYGVHREPLERLREAGCTLAITVDCGITAAEEVEQARSIGLDLIITDHHRPHGPPPPAVAVINPLQEGCPYPFKELAGVGIAYQLAAALFEQAGCGGGPVEDKLDLVALGTVADVVPLTGENRVLVALGLERINRRPRPGLKVLVEESGLKVTPVHSGHLSYILAPALNAAGRMGDPAPAVQLLLEREEAVARPLAVHLRQENRRRREVEQQILAEAEAALQEEAGGGFVGGRILVAAGEAWHPGVIGIVASRLVEKYYRPAVLISLEGENGRGSARSIPGFDITAALAAAASAGLLDRYGGHSRAAGLTLAAEQVPRLAAALESYTATTLQEKDLTPLIFLDGELEEEEINQDLARQLADLKPFGTANPEPVFSSRGWEVRSWRLVGRNRAHLKLELRRGDRSLRPVFFAAAVRATELYCGCALDLVFSLREGFYREQAVLEVELGEFAHGDSYSCGRIAVIDRRGKGGGAEYIRALLCRTAGPVAVFCSTAARRERLRHLLADAGAGKYYFIAGGNGVEKGPDAEGLTQNVACDLVLHDLPLHFSAIDPFFEAAPAGAGLQVHLLYDDRDLPLNEKLVDAALPGLSVLQETGRALRETAAGILSNESFFELLPERAGAGYRRRCLEIFLEEGLLELAATGELRVCAMAAGRDNLFSGAAFEQTSTLRRQCRCFQQQLLEEKGATIATLLERYHRGEY